MKHCISVTTRGNIRAKREICYYYQNEAFFCSIHKCAPALTSYPLKNTNISQYNHDSFSVIFGKTHICKVLISIKVLSIMISKRLFTRR